MFPRSPGLAHIFRNITLYFSIAVTFWDGIKQAIADYVVVAKNRRFALFDNKYERGDIGSFV